MSSIARRLLWIVLGAGIPTSTGPVGLLRRTSARPADLDASDVY